MSLKVAKTFITALRSSQTLQQMLEGRLFSVARSTEDENKDRIPYLIIMPDGIQSQGSEDDYEQTDTATVSILCVAKSYTDLIDITETVRDTLTNLPHFVTEDDGYAIDDYTFSASAVQMDIDKPCYFQTLTYQVNTQKA